MTLIYETSSSFRSRDDNALSAGEWPPEDDHVLIPKAYKHVTLTVNQRIKVVEGVKFINQLTLKHGVYPGLDYPSGPNVVTRVHKCGRGKQNSQSQRDVMEGVLNQPSLTLKGPWL